MFHDGRSCGTCGLLLDSLAQEINMDYLVPETQSYHLDMGTLSGAGEMDAMGHFRELYLSRGQASGPTILGGDNFDLLKRPESSLGLQASFPRLAGLAASLLVSHRIASNRLLSLNVMRRPVRDDFPCAEDL